MPGVLDDFYPSISLEIKYPSGANVHYGNWIDGELVKEKPAVTLHPVGPILDPRVHYYVAMTDPDAPTPLDPKDSEFAHWLMTNITQTCHCNCKEESSSAPKVTFLGPGIDVTGDDLLSYHPPTPGRDTAPHRYVFVLLRPKDLAASPTLPKPQGRRHWGDTGKRYYGIRDYADANGLEVTGANLFYVENRKGAPGGGGGGGGGCPSRAGLRIEL
jgi:hypothetical protein